MSDSEVRELRAEVSELRKRLLEKLQAPCSHCGRAEITAPKGETTRLAHEGGSSPKGFLHVACR